MKKYIAALLAVVMAAGVLLTGCSSSSKGKDDSWNKIKDKGEFVLGLDDNFPPMGFREDGKVVGFDIDLAKEVCKRLGIKLKPQPINWDSKDQELNTGNIDCIWNGFSISPDREKKVLFTKPYMKNRQVLIVMKDSKYDKLSDFKGKKLAVQAESSAVDALNANKDFKASLKEVIELKDNLAALMDLEKGGVDVVLMDEIVARYNIAMKDKGYKVIDQELAKEEYGIGFRKGDKALVEKVQETLDAMAKDGKIEEISMKWFGEDITTLSK